MSSVKSHHKEPHTLQTALPLPLEPYACPLVTQDCTSNHVARSGCPPSIGRFWGDLWAGQESQCWERPLSEQGEGLPPPLPSAGTALTHSEQRLDTAIHAPPGDRRHVGHLQLWAQCLVGPCGLSWGQLVELARPHARRGLLKFQSTATCSEPYAWMCPGGQDTQQCRGGCPGMKRLAQRPRKAPTSRAPWSGHQEVKGPEAV